ncbi:hypothetical protein FHS27_002471 [Rhodopirellula rubra]|uniref:Uncharacterized protein n=1 Tax=Aporhodopirellula rubra TaxID=980271 RepID=A0A7W5DYP4_9BACT|nr:hypothetical protein [Aporhodopirellula rubra]
MPSLSLLLRWTADGNPVSAAVVSDSSDSKLSRSLQIQADGSPQANISYMSIHAWFRRSTDRIHARESGTVFLEPCCGDVRVGRVRLNDAADIHCFPSIAACSIVDSLARNWAGFFERCRGIDRTYRGCWRSYAAVL